MPTELEIMNKNKALIISIIKYSIILVIAILLIYLGANLFALLIPVIIGFVLAHASNSFSRMIYKLVRRKMPRTVEQGGDTKGYRILKLINFTFLLLLFIGLIVLIILALISQVRNLLTMINTAVPATEIITDIANWLKGISKYLGNFLPESTIALLSSELLKIQNEILSAIPKITSSILNYILAFIGNIPGIIFNTIVLVMSGYYFITDKIIIGKFIKELLPSEIFVSKIISIVSKLSGSLFRVFGGYIVIMTVTFIEAIIGLSIIKMPYIVIIALLVTFIDILPAVGASACFYPIAIYMFVQGKIFEGFVALAFVGIMTLVRTVLEPRVIGNAMKLHPLATLIAMILGVAAFGFIGFLGGPILLVLIIAIMDQFGFKKVAREWFGKILNKVATTDTTVSCVQTVDSKVKHIVAWKLKEEALGRSGDENKVLIKEKLMSLPPKIPQILSMQVGFDTKFDETAFDVILITTFANYDDLKIYKEHADHVEVAKFVGQVVSSRTVVDFDI